jgi:hypothetical protein
MAHQVSRQIWGSFEDIGKDIVSQTAKLPTDIAAQAMESLGVGQKSGNTTGQKSVFVGQSDATKKPDQWDKIDQIKNSQNRQAIARSALEALVNKNTRREPTVWEKIQEEEKQKKEMQQKQQIVNEKSNLPNISSARPKGDLYGMKAKRNSAEIGKNVKSD